MENAKPDLGDGPGGARGDSDRPENAYFERSDDGLVLATENTRGPWNPEHQHAGPPAALLAREIELLDGIGESPADRLVGRITYEILRPIPIGQLVVAAEIERPGRRVEMASATLRQPDGTELVRARAWRIKRREVTLPAGLASSEPDSDAQRAGRPSGRAGAMTDPESLEPDSGFFETGHEVGYHSSVDLRSDHGGFTSLGPGAMWMRPRIPLFAGETLSPLQRVMVCADSGNGISVTLDFERYVFINVDLSVHLARMPVGEWVGLDALTMPEPTGLGLTDTMLRDTAGPIGRACQTLMVSER